MIGAITLGANAVRVVNWGNNASSDEPSTTSGVVGGGTSSKFTGPLPRNRQPRSASAMRAPNTVATAVEIAATLRLSFMASTSAGYLKGSAHASRENSFQTKLNFPAGLLKLYRMITKIGRNR